jgi:hypothetical protein
MVGRHIPITEKIEEQLKQEAWQRLAALKAAARYGITTSDEEVLATIQRDERFLVNGMFSKARYQYFTQTVQERLGVSPAHFEEVTREDVTLQKVQHVLGTAAWIPPAELSRSVATYADAFTVKYVTLEPDRLVKDVKATEDEARSFYEAHTNYFVIPEKARVRYVEFPAGRYLASLPTNAEEEIEQYYDDNRKEFLIVTTNAAGSVTNALAAGASTAGSETNVLESLRPLDEVRDAIRTVLVHRASAQAALDAARDFSVTLTPDRQGNAPTFEETAAKAGLTIVTTALFTVSEPLPGISAGVAFNRAAFELRPVLEESFSDGIAGSNAAYVLSFVERLDARVPDFDEIREKVTPLATEYVRRKALEAKAEEMGKAWRMAVKAGKTFEQAVAPEALNIVTTKPFTAFTAPEALGDFDLLREITTRNAGEVTELLESTNGFHLAYVAERKPAEDAAKQAVYQQVLQSLTRHRARLIYTDWQKYLLHTNRFQEVDAVAPAARATGEPINPDLF